MNAEKCFLHHNVMYSSAFWASSFRSGPSGGLFHMPVSYHCSSSSVEKESDTGSVPHVLRTYEGFREKLEPRLLIYGAVHVWSVLLTCCRANIRYRCDHRYSSWSM